jgi:nitrogen fixation NifU-like protein
LDDTFLADGYGKNTGECGDTVEMSLALQGNRISKVAFKIDGCGYTLASAAALARLVEGKTMHAAWGVTPEDVKKLLGNLPPESEHCAELAVGALYRALANAREMQRSSWKKCYQRR